MRSAKPLALAAALLVAGDFAHAEEAPRDSVCALPSPAHDSVQVVVTAIARVDSVNVDHPPKLPPDFLMYVVEAVRTHFVPPARLELLSMAGGMPRQPSEWFRPLETKPHHDSATTPLLAVDAYFTINAHGTPTDIRIGHASMAGTLARSVDSAIRAIVPEDYGLVPPGADGARVRVHVDASPIGTKTEQAFFTAWLPVYHLDRAATAPSHPIFPRYPDNFRNMGISDSVSLAFAVGADGHVIPGTIDVLAAHYTGFIDAVVPALLRNTYRPTVAAGCPVTSTVEQAFTFKVGY